MTAAGLIGVPLGSYVSQILRHNVPNADPIVCGATLMASVPVLFFGFFMNTLNMQLQFMFGSGAKVANAAILHYTTMFHRIVESNALFC